MVKKRDKDGKIERITKTCKVVLDGGGVRITVGDFTLTAQPPGPTISAFADAAYKAASSSLKRLMTPMYRLVVLDEGREEAYGLVRWVKLVDRSIEKPEKKAKKQRIRASA